MCKLLDIFHLFSKYSLNTYYVSDTLIEALGHSIELTSPLCHGAYILIWWWERKTYTVLPHLPGSDSATKKIKQGTGGRKWVGIWKKSNRKRKCKGPVGRTHLVCRRGVVVKWREGCTAGREMRGQGSDHEVKALTFSLGTCSAEEWQDIFDVLQEALQLLCRHETGVRKGGTKMEINMAVRCIL